MRDACPFALPWPTSLMRRMHVAMSASQVVGALLSISGTVWTLPGAACSEDRTTIHLSTVRRNSVSRWRPMMMPGRHPQLVGDVAEHPRRGEAAPER